MLFPPGGAGRGGTGGAGPVRRALATATPALPRVRARVRRHYGAARRQRGRRRLREHRGRR